jgi:hypothetical protein
MIQVTLPGLSAEKPSVDGLFWWGVGGKPIELVGSFLGGGVSGDLGNPFMLS